MSTSHSKSTEGESDNAMLVAALSRLHQLCVASGVYGRDHAAVIRLAGDAAHAFRECIGDQQTLVLGVSRDGFLQAESDEVPSSEATEGLAALLHERDIGVLEVATTVTPEALLAMAALLREHRKAAALIEAVADRTGGAIRLAAVSYGELRADRGGRDRSERPSWQELARTLLQHGGQSPELLAGELNRESQEGHADLAPWRRELQRTTVALSAREPGERRRTVRRLTRFLMGLNPDLRRALLAVEPSAAEDSVEVLELLVSLMPIGEILTALEAVDDADARPSKAAVRLYTKLARIGHRVPAHAARISRMFGDDTMKTMVDVEAYDLDVRESVQETLSTRTNAEFNPGSYAASLDVLCRETVEPVDDAVLTVDAGELRAAAAQGALDLISMDDEGLIPVLDGPFRLLTTRTRELICQGRTDLVLAGVAAARTAVTTPVSPAQGEAARLMLDNLQRSAVADAVLDQCEESDGLPPDCLELLELGAAPALAALLRRPPTPTAMALLAQIQESAGARLSGMLQEAMHLITSSGESGLSALQSLLASVRDDRLDGLLDALAADPDPAVRSAPLQALCGDTALHLPLPIIERSLFDRERAIRELAAERLSERCDAAGIESMKRVLAGRLGGELAGLLPELDMYDRLLDTVSSHPDAVMLLAGINDKLRWTKSATRAGVSVRVLGRLWKIRKQPRARRAILRWWLSPAPWVLILNRPLWERPV